MATETTTEKAKRLAIKILEKDFDQLTAWQEKWSKKKKGVEFTLEEVIDYVLQTATVRIEALQKYAKKTKAARKEAAAKRPPKPKKVKAVKEKKPKAAKKTKAAKDEEKPSAPPAPVESASPKSEPPEQTGGVVEGAPTEVEDPAIEKVLAESRAARAMET